MLNQLELINQRKQSPQQAKFSQLFLYYCISRLTEYLLLVKFSDTEYAMSFAQAYRNHYTTSWNFSHSHTCGKLLLLPWRGSCLSVGDWMMQRGKRHWRTQDCPNRNTLFSEFFLNKCDIFASNQPTLASAAAGQQSLAERSLALDTERTTWNTFHSGLSFGNPTYLSTAYKG